jgi:hypothetical protein
MNNATKHALELAVDTILELRTRLPQVVWNRVAHELERIARRCLAALRLPDNDYFPPSVNRIAPEEIYSPSPLPLPANKPVVAPSSACPNPSGKELQP